MEFLKEEFDEILEIFRVESEEIVERFNNNLLSIEKSPENTDMIMELFRDAHSIKGAARMIGFNNIQDLAHKIEDILGLAKEGQLLITRDTSTVIYKTTDYILYLVQESVKQKKEVVPADFQSYIAGLVAIIDNNQPPQVIQAPINQPTPGVINVTESSQIDELIKKVAEESGESNEGKSDTPSGIDGEAVEHDYINHCIEYLISSLSSLRNGLEPIEDIKAKLQELIDMAMEPKVNAVYGLIQKALDILAEQSTTPSESIVKAMVESVEPTVDILNNKHSHEDISLVEQKLNVLLEMLLLDSKKNSNANITTNKTSPLEPQFQKAQSFFKTYETGTIKTLRVDTQKLDQLVNQIGELIISKMKTKNHLAELELIHSELEDWYSFSYKSINYLKYYDKKMSSKTEHEDFDSIINSTKQILHIYEESSIKIYELNQKINNLYKQIMDDDIKFTHIVDDLEHMVKNVRVLPLATVFHMFPRMVRDISLEKGKEVELLISGSETSADKKIIEEIKTPIIHILRNSIDHGIETPQERILAKKPPCGRIQLNAKNVGNKIVIEVIDDGHGINLEKIKEKALRLGLLSKEEIVAMTNVQIMNLIFWPGFSTEDKVTELSGRGIGLDIVQGKITQLNGTVKVLSNLGYGCKVIIELPTTMATLKTFIVSVEEQPFAIPMSAIKTVLWLKEEDLFIKETHYTIIYNGETVPVFDLADILHYTKSTAPKPKQTVVILEVENVTVGYIVDKLLGDQEVLHKKLEPPIYKLKNISGITTLASGEVCLILNVADLLKSSFATNTDLQLLKQKDEQRKSLNKIQNNSVKILVVDDSATTRTLLKNILLSAGYDFKLANDPIEAIKRMSYDTFDLIITDVEMPNMTGWEFCNHLRHDENYQSLPIIVLTSIDPDEAFEKTKAHKANAFIAKSQFNQSSFLELLDTLLKK